MTSEYLITVVTGSRKGAGTDASVSLIIKGTNGETDALSLDKWFHNDFEAGQKDEYQITAKDVGELLLVTLKNDQGGLYSDWFVNRVTIKIKGKDTVYDFPCNRWVQSETIIFEGAAKLPTDKQHGSVKSQREEELKQRRSLYEWGTDAAYSDLPGFVKASGVKELPRDVQFTEEASYDLHAARRNALINMGLVHLFNIFDSWDDFDDYRKAFTSFIGEVPKAADHWKDDRFFGYQFLNGCNPDSIKRCTQLPTNFAVTQQLIGNLLDTGDTLEKAMNMITHLLRTHLFMEPIAVASYRQLPTIHPLWKLLSPHIRGVLAINTLGRDRLIAEGGVADLTLTVGGGGHITLMKKYYKAHSNWKTYDIPQVLKERGVDEVDKLPNFHYREDALKLWAAIKEFVKEIISVYYSSDDAIKKDYELQNWIKDLHDNGYPVTKGHVDHGVPKSFTSCQQLCEFLECTIFTCACQHAAVNFSQLDVYGFPPNSPALMRQPPPTKKGVVTMEHMMKCLATKHQVSLTIATVYDLTRIYQDERFIGDYREDLFIDPPAKSAISSFQKKLKQISAEIKERNANLEIPYPYLLPERIPNSIAI